MEFPDLPAGAQIERSHIAARADSGTLRHHRADDDEVPINDGRRCHRIASRPFVGEAFTQVHNARTTEARDRLAGARIELHKLRLKRCIYDATLPVSGSAMRRGSA